MSLYDRIRIALHAEQRRPVSLAEPVLQDLQRRIERDHRQADQPVRLWACLLARQPEACWVGVWLDEHDPPQECPNCGSDFALEPVSLDMQAADRTAVWLALCAGKLQLPDPWEDDA